MTPMDIAKFEKSLDNDRYLSSYTKYKKQILTNVILNERVKSGKPAYTAKKLQAELDNRMKNDYNLTAAKETSKLDFQICTLDNTSGVHICNNILYKKDTTVSQNNRGVIKNALDNAIQVDDESSLKTFEK